MSRFFRKHKMRPLIFPIVIIALIALLLALFFTHSTTNPSLQPPYPATNPRPCNWTSGIFAEDIAAAKALAIQNSRPLLVMVGNSGCPWCQQAKADVLDTSEWQSYAHAKGLSLTIINTTSPDMAAVLAQVQTLYNATSWPHFLILEALPTASLTDANLDASNVRLIGSFRYRAGEDIINGIPVTRDGPSNFISIIESFTGQLTDCSH